MLVKTYIRKHTEIRAVQYDGTPDHARDLMWNFQNLGYDGLDLYLTANYVKEYITKGDWIIVNAKSNHAIEVLSDDEFYHYYELKKK